MLDARGVSVDYEGPAPVHAVRDVWLRVHPGELVGVVGESGCGKSTLARALLGLLLPPARQVAGEVSLVGIALDTLSTEAVRSMRGPIVGFIPQNPFSVLSPVMRIGAQFRDVIRAHRRLSGVAIRELATDRLLSVGIRNPARVLDSYISELSGGMAQRVVLAIATILDPVLIVADEPTTGLDITVQRQVLDTLSLVLNGSGRSIVLITHDLGVVAQYCRRVIVMYAGRIVESGPLTDVFLNPVHPYTRALIDSSPTVRGDSAVLEGRPPDLTISASGCVFFDRCPIGDEKVCTAIQPALESVGNSIDHFAACYFPQGK